MNDKIDDINDILLKLINRLSLKLTNINDRVTYLVSINNEEFDITFEKRNDNCYTSEIPDWTITRKSDKKTIIGMNQIDLWTGGAQSNRAGKYILINNESALSKYVCVICSMVKISRKVSKKYDIFTNGFRNNSLCYISKLEYTILDYYKI